MKKSLKKTFWLALLFIGNLSPGLEGKESLNHSHFESRLQQLHLEKQETKRLHQLFELYWEWLMEQNPDYASYLGYPGYHNQWPNLSLEAIEQRTVLIKQFLETLIAIDSNELTSEDLLSYQMLKKEFELDLEGMNYPNHYMPITQMQGIHLDAPMIINLMPTETLIDYENILTRLRLFPLLIDQTITLLMEGLKIDVTPPKIALRHVPQQILNQIVENPLESHFLTAFLQFPEHISQSDQNRLLQEAQEVYINQVSPALCKLYRYFIDDYLPYCRKTIALSDLPNGKAWYAFEVKQLTTTNLSPEEIHHIGLMEVDRIYQEMIEMMKSVNFEGNFSDFIQFLQTDPQFFYQNRNDLLEGYRALTKAIESRLPRLFNQLPSLPFEVVPVPSYSEESQIGAYYCQGSLIQQRPGYFFINLSHLQERPKWEMEPLALHEAVPGHHLQLSIAQELKNLPDFRKNISYTAFIEGWGLYAEGLGIDLDLYQDPYSKFGRLTYEMFRAIRLVVDTGMHAMGWSRQEAIDFFKKFQSMNEHEIITEVDRYLVIPAQALAYKIGELKIKEMRKLAADTLKDEFDIREFHDEWLKHGTVPLDVAEDLIKKWIQMKTLENQPS